jgi:hypothetical protein
MKTIEVCYVIERKIQGFQHMKSIIYFHFQSLDSIMN